MSTKTRRISWTVAAILWVLLAFAARKANGQEASTLASFNVSDITGPVLRDNDILRVYIGSAKALGTDPRVILSTSRSISVNADLSYPWHQTGENEAWYWWPDVRVVTDNDPCKSNSTAACRDTGWVDLKMPDIKIEVPRGSNNWIPDKDARIIVHIVDAASRGICSSEFCGAVLIVPRMKLSDVVVAMRRREVVP